MIKLPLIEGLMYTLPLEYKEKLQELLIGDSCQPLFCQCAQQHFPFEAVELLANYFGIPMGCFSSDNLDGWGRSQSTNIVHGSNNLVANVGLSQDVELERLRQQVKGLQATLDAKEETLQTMKQVLEARAREIELKDRMLKALAKFAPPEAYIELL